MSRSLLNLIAYLDSPDTTQAELEDFLIELEFRHVTYNMPTFEVFSRLKKIYEKRLKDMKKPKRKRKAVKRVDK